MASYTLNTTVAQEAIVTLSRSYQLAGWEPVNSALRWTLDRGDLGDGSYVAAATNYAAAACGN